MKQQKKYITDFELHDAEQWHLKMQDEIKKHNLVKKASKNEVKELMRDTAFSKLEAIKWGEHRLCRQCNKTNLQVGETRYCRYCREVTERYTDEGLIYGN